MGFEVFDKDIKNGLKNIYLFHGHEQYLIEQYIVKMIKKYIADSYKEFNVFYFDGEKVNVEELLGSCETLPFFSEHKIIIVKNVQFFKNKKGVLSDSAITKLIEYFKNPLVSTHLIMISNDNIDLRKKITKSVKENGSIIEFNKLDSKIFAKWIHRKIKLMNKDIEMNELKYLVERFGYLNKNSEKNLLEVDNEIKMICSSIITREFIKIEDIDRFIKKPLEADIFKMVDAVGAKKAETALVIMNDLLLSGEAIQVIFAMVSRQFRLLKKIKIMVSEGYTQASIAKVLKLHPYVVKMIMRQINSFNTITLTIILQKCSDLDYKVKNTSIDFRLKLETLIVECSLLIK